MSKTCLSGAIAAIILATAGTASAATSEPTLQDQQQAACYGDVQKLCGDAMPDVEKVTACMKTKRSQVSARCASFYGRTK